MTSGNRNTDNDLEVSKDFYEFCYRQYEFEMKETDQLYQRVSFVLVFLSLLGSIIFRLGRIDIIDQTFIRVDIFLYYLSIAVAMLVFYSSIIYGIRYALPRKSQYKTVASMNLWTKWRKEYSDYLSNSGEIGKSPDQAFLREISDKLAEAQSNNAPINEKRRQYFHCCVYLAAIGIIPVSLQAFFYLILKLQGV